MSPKPLPPYLRHEKTRHGRLVWYVRFGIGPRTRLRAPFGSVEFWTEYEAIVGAMQKPAKGASGSFSWALALYLRSQDWGALSLATQRQRLAILRKIDEAVGTERVKDWLKSDVIAGRDKRAATPAAARHFVDALHGMFGYLVAAALVETDPTEGVRVRRPKSDGFEPWTPDDEARFLARWPDGSRERLAFIILRETGLRRGDVVRLGRQHVRDGVIRITTEKTSTPAVIPVTDRLQAALDAAPAGDNLAFLPMTKESFGNVFRDACRAAGIEKSAHGLRKTAAEGVAYEGWTDKEMDARFGWTGGRMSSLYTRKAERERLAIGAAERTKRAQGATAPDRAGDRTLKKSKTDQ